MVAPIETPQFALMELQVKLEASIATGARGEVVVILIELEFKLVLQPLLARNLK